MRVGDAVSAIALLCKAGLLYGVDAMVANTGPAAEAKIKLAELAVSAMYANFPVEYLEDLLAVGRQYAAVSDHAEVAYMNEALIKEIERRRAIGGSSR